MHGKYNEQCTIKDYWNSKRTAKMSSQEILCNAIQLEDITHFQRDFGKPHPSQQNKSILSTHNLSNFLGKKFPKSVSYQLSSPQETGDKVQVEADISTTTNPIESDPLAGPSPSQNRNDVERDFSSSDYGKFKNFENSPSQSSLSSAEDDFSGSDSEDIYEFPGKGPSDKSLNNNKSKIPEIGEKTRDKKFKSLGQSVSDENLFPTPSIQVTRTDLVLAVVGFLNCLCSFLCDFVLVFWHYNTGLKWGSGLTSAFIGTGGLAMMYQFGLLKPNHLDRLFRKGKRTRILVSCFPPATSLIVSYQSVLTAWRALQDPMVSQQFFKLEEFLRSLYRIQSVFQAAPQAILQLLVFLENYQDTSWEKGIFTLTSIAFSLTIMTNANLPSKLDAMEDSVPSKAAFVPLTRIYMAARMFSSFGSRTMGVTYLILGSRCVFDPNASLLSTVIALSLLILPRFLFTLVDFFILKVAIEGNLERYRQQPELGISSSQPIRQPPFCTSFSGYLATIYFPVGDPYWLFWYVWCESGIFVVFGNIAIETSKREHGCLEGAVNATFTGIFIVLFVVVPILIPYVKVVVHKRKVDRMRRVLHDGVHEQNYIENVDEGTYNNNSSTCSGLPSFSQTSDHSSTEFSKGGNNKQTDANVTIKSSNGTGVSSTNIPNNSESLSLDTNLQLAVVTA